MNFTFLIEFDIYLSCFTGSAISTGENSDLTRNLRDSLAKEIFSAGYIALTLHSAEWLLIVRQVRNECGVVVECPEYSAYLSPGNIGREETAVQQNTSRASGHSIWYVSTTMPCCWQVRSMEGRQTASPPSPLLLRPRDVRRACHLCTCNRSHVRSITIERTTRCNVFSILRDFACHRKYPLKLLCKRDSVAADQLTMTAPFTNS